MLAFPGMLRAQCAAGYSQATLNWDYLDYFVYTGNYTSANGYLPSNALSQTQNFAFGLNRLTISHNYADANSLGENTAHTGEAGSYGTGADINFTGNGTITLTFETEVNNLKFSIYDLDNSQSTTISGNNAMGVPELITMGKANAASAIVIAGSGTTTATATSLVVGAIANNLNTAVINIDITSPVKTITISMGGTADDFWISDITACTPGSFPNNYYAVSKPFTGMPGYVLHAFDKSVYAVNPLTGITKLLFTDPMSLGSSSFINSMGYDVYNRILYYVFSLTATPGTNRILRKYDFNTDVMSTVVADLNTIGVPTTSFTGIESGAAAFYNGSLYLGVETPNSGRTSGRESIIWRLDFDASNIPYRASQVYGLPADDGVGTLLHDWSDFTITNGVLYDFDGAGGTTQTDIYQYNLMTGATVNYPLPAGFTPGQPTVAWNNNIYQLHAINPGTNPYVALYNPAAGTIGVRTNLTSTPAFVPAIPSLGDAAEAFRPLCDFGDAPASYDPVAGDPAVHELDPLLYLGTSVSKEWVTRGQTAPANSDNLDDAFSSLPPYNPPTGQYLIQAKVFNNTGANATMVGWLDYNGNGVFDASEGLTYNVPSSASVQNIYLYWNGITSPLTYGSTTYLRIRLTSASNGMTTANPTGYFSNGEVEDYKILVNFFSLGTQLLSFDAQKVNDKNVQLDWNTTGEQTGTLYELQRSANSQNWSLLYQQTGTGNTSSVYSYQDLHPGKNKTYYRLKIKQPDGSVTYSKVKMINFSNELSWSLTPNPASDVVRLTLNTDVTKSARVTLLDIAGRNVYMQDFVVEPGSKNIPLSIQHLLNGMYTVQVQLDQKIYTQKLVIKK